jgi:hypothetical protein
MTRNTKNVRPETCSVSRAHSCTAISCRYYDTLSAALHQEMRPRMRDEAVRAQPPPPVLRHQNFHLQLTRTPAGMPVRGGLMDVRTRPLTAHSAHVEGDAHAQWPPSPLLPVPACPPAQAWAGRSELGRPASRKGLSEAARPFAGHRMPSVRSVTGMLECCRRSRPRESSCGDTCGKSCCGHGPVDKPV